MMKKVGAFLSAMAVTCGAWADYSRVEWIEADGKQWIDALVKPASTDRIEMKVRFKAVDTTQCLYCSRGTENMTNTFTSFLVGGKVRFDRNAGSATADAALAAGTDYDVTADYATLAAGVAPSDASASASAATLPSGDYEPGSRLTFFASHTDGYFLGAASTMGNWGSYRLYSVRLLDAAGNVTHEFVPAKDDDAADGSAAQYGLFDLTAKRFCPNLGTAAFTAGAPVGGDALAEENLDWNVVDVPAGETRRLTADEVAAFGARTLLKTGAGTLVAGAEMADFAGDIRIRDGFYDATVKGAFGTHAGMTFVEGGTILSRVGAPVTWTAQGGEPSYGSETFHLRGNGCEDKGAIRTLADTFNFAGAGGIVLDGDIRVTGTSHLEFRYGTVRMNGRKITVAMDTGKYFRLVALTILDGGDVEVVHGEFGLEGGTDEGAAVHTFTVNPGTVFRFNMLGKVQRRRVVLKADAIISMNNTPNTEPGKVDANTNLGGPIEVEGATRVTASGPGRVLNLSGTISGAGGFSATMPGTWLQFAGSGHTFTGGLSAVGTLTLGDDLCQTGGVTFVGGQAAPPADGGPIALTNAQMRIYSTTDAAVLCKGGAQAFPEVRVDGTGVVTAGVSVTGTSVQALRKTGAGPLTVFGALEIVGETEVAGGTLRFGTRVPDAPSGLNWWYVYNRGSYLPNLPEESWLRGVDPAGASFGYRDWPATWGADNAVQHQQSHTYDGYVRVPGEEGATVSCNFVSSMCRSCYVKIGEQVVVNMQDITDALTGVTQSNWDRFYMGPKVELNAGWQPVRIILANYWNGSSGPLANTKYGWEANFGLGVDWQGRGEAVPANYAKFLDPGDGSFLRPQDPSLGKASLDPAAYRPTFGGAVAFGPGAVLDVNDTAPYTPVTIPELKGLPTIRNGAVTVQGTTWTVRADDFGPGAAPLTVEEGASLAFAAGTTLAFEGDFDELSHAGAAKTRPFVRTTGGAISNLPTLSGRIGTSDWYVQPAADGSGWDVHWSKGFVFLVR